MRRRGIIAFGLLALGAIAASPVCAADDPAVTGVQVARDGDQVVCRLTTRGLPGDKILSTLSSGLESAIEIRLELQGDDVRVSPRSYLLRLSYDLWEEVYTVYTSGGTQRFGDAKGLIAFLAAPPPLVIAPLAELDARRAVRLVAGLKLMPLAPAERGRMQEMVSGVNAGKRRAGDEGQEVSVSLGTLIRFFYRGGGSARDLVGVFRTQPFTVQELSDGSD